ncbi:MAG TPA: hypothetical protein VMW70_11785 [Burkholderiales bacterium]|nr:hypothetical protein [Burkholderiales bacterium]
MQADIASKNAASLRSKHDKMPDIPEDMPEDTEERPTLATAPGGDETHSHELQQGEAQTEGAEDDGHIHAVNYDDDGAAVLEPAEGHSHELPPAADVTADVEAAEEEAEEYEAAGVEPTVTKGFTDWPQPGMNLPVSLLTSEYRAFPLAEAKALRDDWPEIWGLINLDEGSDIASRYLINQDICGDPYAVIRTREAWAAKHIDGYSIEDVVSQIKHLVRGSRGIEYMRLMLSHAKEQTMNERDKAKGLSPEQIEAITDRIVSKAVVPAIERAFRQQSGRLS